MRPVENIENLIKNAEMDTNANTNEAVLGDVLKAFEKSKNKKSALVQPSIWRIIMKSKITKLAAAAIIIAFMLITYLGNVTLDLTSTAFAQMTEAMKKKPWLHAISQFYGDQEMKWSESWYSFAQKIVARKDTDGTASYLDLLNNKEYIYNPTTDIVTVTYRPNDNADLILRSESPWKVVETMIETFEAQGAVHKCRNGQYQSKDVYIYDLIMSEKSHGKAEIKIISDRDKNLLLVWKSRVGILRGNLLPMRK